MDLKKEKENPLANPTPAILEVLKIRNSSAPVNIGKRIRTESHCCSPVFYDNSILTPAMEEVIRRRERNLHKNEDNESKSPTTSIATRSNKLKHNNDSYYRKETCKSRRNTVKTSAPENKTPIITGLRGRTRKYLLQEQKLMTDLTLNTSKKSNTQKNLPSTKRNIRKCRKGLPTLAKSPNKKSLGFSKKKKIRHREVSPSEIDFVPRLRSGVDYSTEYIVDKMLNCARVNPKIRNYAANSPCPSRRRKRINCSALSPSARDSPLIL